MSLAGNNIVGEIVAKAREQGKRDSYLGKRTWARYSLGMRMTVSTDPTIPGAGQSVMIHNVSGGGLAFWSKREWPSMTSLHVNVGGEDASAWLCGKVTHCSVGLRGYLVGIVFDDPAPPDEEYEMQLESGSGTVEDTSQSGQEPVCWRHLAARAVLPCLIVGSATAFASLLIFGEQLRLIPANALRIASAAGAVTAILTLAGIFVTRSKRAAYLDSILEAVRNLAGSSANQSTLAEAPFAELIGLRQAVMDLQKNLQRREYGERLQREKLQELAQMKSNILAIVSHDLRTPLTSILLYAKMLHDERDTIVEKDETHFLGIIVEECNRLSRLVNDLLEVQRLESDEVRWNLMPQDLASIINNCANVFEAVAKNKSMTLAVSCPESLPAVAADSDKIKQVLHNLVSNALKYTQAQGTVEVSAEVRGNQAIIQVADNGPGIPREKWDQVFDRFSQLGDADTAEVAGVGLGLHIVKKIVEGHGGVAWIDSEVGHGSRFFVSLPLATDSDAPSTNPDLPGGSQRIVVCDADPELAATVTQALRLHNYQVRTVYSGKRLLAVVDQGDVDIVVTDITLPDMDADDVLRQLRNLRSGSFGLIIHSFEGESDELLAKGAHVFLERPVSQQDLIEAVHVACQKHQSGGKRALLVSGGGVDTNRLSRLLADAGHSSVIIDSLSAASDTLGDFGADFLIFSKSLLNEDWSDIAAVRDSAAERTRILVLCEQVRRQERRFEDALGVMTLQYRAGEEERVLGAVTGLKELCTVEAVG